MAPRYMGQFVMYSVLIVLLSGCWSKEQVAKQVPVYGPHYCYASLAEPDCYAGPPVEDGKNTVDWHEAPSGTREIKIEVQCYSLFFVKKFCPEL